jgi:acetyl-CoA synthetase
MIVRHDPTTYDSVRRDYRWQIPARFNIARAICEEPARIRPEAPALIYIEADGTTHTYTCRQLDELASRFANALAALGVGPGSIVGLNLAQCPETVITHIATAKLGAIVLPLAVLFGPDALRYRLTDSGAQVLITTQEGYERCATILREAPALRQTIIVGDTPGAKTAAGDRDFWTLLERGAPERRAPDTAADDPALMLYTSGTTGQPKGVLLAHRTILGTSPGAALIHDGLASQGGEADDRIWTPADWAWAGGLNGVLWPALLYGAPLIATPPMKFDPEWTLAFMGRHKVRNVFIPPTALRFLSALDPAHVRTTCTIRSLFTGGEKLGPELIAWGRDAFGVTLSEAFGQTEANLVIGNSPKLFPIRIGSMGRALPGHEVEIVDETGNVLPSGTPGLVALRRPDPVIMLEYWRRPDATAEKFIGDWLIYGDRATKDTDGYFWFQGRNDDIIKSSGYRIGPTEVEDCLVQHPAVRLAGVIGTPDAIRGEAVTAFIVLAEGHTASDGLAADIQTFVRVRLAAHEYPRKIRFIADMPMTVTGKIRRLDLRALAQVPSGPDGTSAA